MGPLRGLGLVVIATVVHLILCYSVIDIHFQSPIIEGIPPVWPDTKPHAKRLILIVADGLRPDYLFKNKPDGTPLAPFLRHLATCVGRYGISHTRPPTESRPGHVALTAGFYEDPSALFSGWQDNLTPFDSIFRHVAGGWGLGSPDVVPIWNGHGNYSWRAYNASMEDWGLNTDLTSLDTWVFDQTAVLLDEVYMGNVSALHQGPAVLLLHLLGLDSQSHAHGGPHAQQYLDNIQTVNGGVARTVQMFESRFPDDSTIYLFTADHGMTDHASHGDASPECTRTPFIIWGPGVSRNPGIPESCARMSRMSKPSIVSHVMWHALIKLDVHDVLGWRAGRVPWACAACRDVPWSVESPERLDIHQAQLAPLMAALLGVPAPTNAMFTLPSELISSDEHGRTAPHEFRAKALWANVRSLLAAYDARAKTVRKATLLFRHHPGLQAHRDNATNEIESLLQRAHYEQVLQPLADLGAHAEASLLYLQRYHWLLLYTVVFVLYVLWMLWVVMELLQDSGGRVPDADGWQPWRIAARKAEAGVYAAMALVLAVMANLKVPATFWAYAVCLGLLAGRIVRNLPVLLRAGAAACRLPSAAQVQPLAVAGLTIAIAQGFLFRPIYAGLCVCLAAATVHSFRRSPFASLAAIAAASLLCTGAFAVLPLRKEPSTALVILPGIAAVCAVTISHAAAIMLQARTDTLDSSRFVMGVVHAMRGGWWVLWLQSVLAMVACACIIATQRPTRTPEPAGGTWQHVAWQADSVLGRLNPPLMAALEPVGQWIAQTQVLHAASMPPTQALLWGCFCLAPALPLLTRRNTLPRLLSSLFGFHILFIIMTISWEAVFFACFACTLVAYSLLMTAVNGGVSSVGRTPVAMNGSGDFATELSGVGNPIEADDAAAAVTRSPIRRRSASRGAEQCAGSRYIAEADEPRQGVRSTARRRKRSVPARRRSRTPARRSHTVEGNGHVDPPVGGALDPPVGNTCVDAGLSMAEIWYAFALVLSMNLGFFGTGNMASVASFEPASVLRLMTRFDKFRMGALLMLKIILPLFASSCVFSATASWLQLNHRRKNMLVLVLSDMMALKFFLEVTSEGSWQVIGTSISHFGVMNVQVIIVMLLSSLSNMYLGVS